MWDSIWINANLATMDVARMVNDNAYGEVENAAIAVEGDRIAWVGPMKELPGKPDALARQVRDASGRWVTPGLVDCHTHLVYGGNRAHEFEMRLNGASYEEVAKAGGGIVSTVKATRAASEEELLLKASERLERLMEEGVTTVEIKSGYGLNTETEMRMLRVARRLAEQHSVKVQTTFLGAHALPEEYAGRADDYITLVCEEMIPAVADAGLADAVDAFCEGIGFSPEQTNKVFDCARRHGLPVKLHADQLSDLNGAGIAASHNALSADHLEYTNEEAIKKMAASGSVAVLLPGAFYFLRETKMPPLEHFRQHGVPIALATDSNPGSSPVTSLLLMMNMACTIFRMTPAEALAGVTIHGAKALGLGDHAGSLEVGKAADFVLWDVDTPAELSYRIGDNPCAGVVVAGHISR